MRITQESLGRQFLVPSLLLVVMLTACGSGNADATPTLGVDAIFTAAAQTIEAQQATELALTPPTNTPAPSPFPTLPPPSPVATFAFASSTPLTGGASLCDNSAYVADVSIPDGTTIKAGEKFTKTWRIYNSGSCAWTTAYKLVFDSGDAMGGATTLIPAAVPAGQQTDISVAMTAPTTNGTFKGNWRMQNDKGLSFGNVIYVEIKVGSGSGTAAPTSASGTITISGTLNVGEVTISFSSASSTPTVTYTSGGYSFTVPSGWSGTITPSKGNSGNWSFDPSSWTFTNVTSDQTRNFTAVSVTPTP
ncbi:MAG: NBR1-Ig-like domain-containing protein [Chloroflexota bacterium]